MFGLVFAGIVWVTPYFRLEDGSFPFHYYGLIIVIYLIHQVRRFCSLELVCVIVKVEMVTLLVFN